MLRRLRLLESWPSPNTYGSRRERKPKHLGDRPFLILSLSPQRLESAQDIGDRNARLHTATGAPPDASSTSVARFHSHPPV